MVSKEEIIAKANELGFDDIGFTHAEPFNSQEQVLISQQEDYAWTTTKGFNLVDGTDPKKDMSSGKSIIVLLIAYFHKGFPPSLENHFGRCYIDDFRMTKVDWYQKIKQFRGFLRDNGIDSKVPKSIPQRIAAARAGLGNFGKNCLLYSNKIHLKSSFVLPVPIVVDKEFTPDESTYEIGCPDWCRNVCIISCPTGALKGPRKIDPRRCISYLTYFGEGPTPMGLREPMGMWVYGCDRCQDVCPRNRPQIILSKSTNQLKERVKDFNLVNILHMDRKYFRTKIWPQMFYMPLREMWRWKMNAARAMGNSLDPKYIPELIRAYNENKDDRVKCLIVWALGRIGGLEAKESLDEFLESSEGTVKEEIEDALKL